MSSQTPVPWRTFVAVAFLSTASNALHAADAAGTRQDKPLRVGAAAVNLEADDSMVIAGGIGPRYVKGQEGHLRATAVLIEQPGFPPVAIVACDVLFVPRDIVDAALGEIATRTGIPASHVLVSATHTHSAPSLTRVHGYERDEVFAQRVQRAIVEAVQSAQAKLTHGESEFLFCMGEEKTVGANSRQLLADGMIYWVGPMNRFVRPTGPFDPQLPVLAFRGIGGNWQALIYGHSTHTIGARSGNVRSPSFYGLAAQELEAELGATVEFLEGASGSTHNIQGITAADATNRMKEAVRDALKRAAPQPTPRVTSIKRPFTYQVRRFDENVEEDKVVTYCKKYIPSAWEAVAKVFRDMRAQLASQQGQDRVTQLQAIAIGDVAIAGVPAEYFTGLGVEIKKRSPFPHTVVVELANDWIGYLPDREAHQLGGYQTWMGFHSYVELGTGERVADEIISMLSELQVSRE